MNIDETKNFKRIVTINRAVKRIKEIENENKDVINEYKRLLTLYYRNEVNEVVFDRIHKEYMEFRENVRNYENMVISYTLALLNETDEELGLFIKTNNIQRQKFIKGVRTIFDETERKHDVNIKELFEEVINNPKKRLNNE